MKEIEDLRILVALNEKPGEVFKKKSERSLERNFKILEEDTDKLGKNLPGQKPFIIGSNGNRK